MLETLVQRGHCLDRVDLGRRLVRAQVGDAREAQREPGLVPVRADDDVERDLDDDERLHLAVAPVPGDRVGLEPAGHLGDLGIGQAAVRLADRDQAVGRGVADGERVVGQHPVPLAVADLDADDDAIDGRERLLHLQPAQAAATRRIAAGRVLDHQALVAPGTRRREGRFEGVRIVSDRKERADEPATLRRRRQVDRVEAFTAGAQAARAAALRPARCRPRTRRSRGHRRQRR